MRDVINVVFVCAATAGGWRAGVCVLVQWREATPIRSNTNSLRAPGFGGVDRVSADCVCFPRSL